MITDSLEQRDDGIQQLTEAQGSFKAAGVALAEAERAYRVAKAVKVLKLRDEGQPATIIGDLVNGDSNIAELRMERDICEVEFKAVQSNINTLKLELRLINDEINREWNSGGLGDTNEY